MCMYMCVYAYVCEANGIACAVSIKCPLSILLHLDMHVRTYVPTCDCHSFPEGQKPGTLCRALPFK